MNKSTESCLDKLKQLKTALDEADAVIIGAGSGLSTATGFTYSGERFERYFYDFAEKYHIRDIYSGGFCTGRPAAQNGDSIRIGSLLFKMRKAHDCKSAQRQ